MLITQVDKLFHEKLRDNLVKEHMIAPGIVEQWRGTLMKLSHYGGMSTCNHVTIYPHGDRVFRDMWEEIDEAEERVSMSTYIFEVL